jgi:hypothetical protein
MQPLAVRAKAEGGSGSAPMAVSGLSMLNPEFRLSAHSSQVGGLECQMDEVSKHWRVFVASNACPINHKARSTASCTPTPCTHTCTKVHNIPCSSPPPKQTNITTGPGHQLLKRRAVPGDGGRGRLGARVRLGAEERGGALAALRGRRREPCAVPPPHRRAHYWREGLPLHRRALR